MKKWLVCLKDQRGTTFPLVVAVTLAYLLIPYGITEFLHLSLIASGVKEAPQDTVIAVVNDNYANVYHGARKGYSGGYYAEEYSFGELVDTEDIYCHLDETLGTWREERTRVKYTGGVPEHKIFGLDVTIHNVPLTPPDPVSAQRSEADAVIWLEVPVQFTGKTFPLIKVKLKVWAGYIGILREVGGKKGEMGKAIGPLERVMVCYVMRR